MKTSACAAMIALRNARMRFSAMAEALCWGFPRMPGPGSSALRWSRWAHYQNAINKQNKGRPSLERFAIDIKPALEHFKIQWPVSIYIQPLESIGPIGILNSRAFYTNGETIEAFHRMVLADCLGADCVSALAWHELCHAAQTESDHAKGFLVGKGSIRLYEAAFPARGSGWRRYTANKYEKEAYEAMNNHYSVSKLTLDN